MLHEASGHAGAARKILRAEEARSYADSYSPYARHALVPSNRRTAWSKGSLAALPPRICIEGLRHIGAKANGEYVCTVVSSEAQRLCLPSIIYEKQDGSGVSLFYDSGLWSIASSVGAEESLAYAEVTNTNPCSIPRSRWQTSDGATWVAAPARFSVLEIDDYEFDDYHATPRNSSALDDLTRDITELSLGLVPKRHVRAKLDDMLEAAREIEQDQLTLEDELDEAIIEMSASPMHTRATKRPVLGTSNRIRSPRRSPAARRNLGLESF